jgi:hypothetical protein
MSSSASSKRPPAARALDARVLSVRDPSAVTAADIERADVVCVDVGRLAPDEAPNVVRALAHKGLPVIAVGASGGADRLLAAGAVHVLDAGAADTAVREVLGCAAQMAQRWSSRVASRQARSFLRMSIFECRTPDEAYDLAAVVAGLLELTQNATFGLLELLMNAVEHGNLEISHDEKTALMISGTLYDEIARRLAMPCYRDRKVTVRVTRNHDRSGAIAISDDGIGFDWRAHMAALDGDYGGRGRGIALARELSFPDLEFHDPGNVVLVNVPAPT